MIIKTKDGSVTLEFGGVIEESHSLKAQVTQNPVASGAKVSDNINLLPRQYTLEGRITPYDADSITSGIKPQDFITYKWNDLKRIWISKQLLEITTETEKYDNMVITDISHSRTTENATVLDFNATITEIFLVNTQGEINYNFQKGSTENQGSPVRKIGYKEAKDLVRTKQQEYLNKIRKQIRNMEVNRNVKTS